MINRIKKVQYSFHLIGTSFSKNMKRMFSPEGLRIDVHLTCPFCKYFGRYIQVHYFPKKFPKKNKQPEFFISSGKHKTWKPCPKCNKYFNFIIDENCRFEERDYS